MMKLRFVQKRYDNRPSGRIINSVVKVEQTDNINEVVEVPEDSAKKNNKKKKKGSEMNTNEKIATAEAVLDAMAPEVKVVKKDRGLI